MRRPHPVAGLARLRHARAQRAGGGRRLRPRRAVPVFRRRRADPAAGAARRPGHRRSWRSSSSCSGTWASRSATASAPSTNACPSRRPTSRCRPACWKRGSSPAAAACSTSCAVNCREAMDPQAFFHAKTLETAAAPRQVRGHRLQPGAEQQGKPGRPARPAGDPVGRQGRAASATPGASWPTRGLITPTEARQLTEKERAFKDIRIRLHLHAKRREDRLVFDVQTPIAAVARLHERPRPAAPANT